MLVANAVVDTDQPRLQVGENQMDDRQVLLGNLWITTLGNSEVLIAALTEASIAAPIVSNDQRSRRDGALDEPTERWTLLTKVETSCDRILIAGGANVEAEWEQGPAV